MFEQEDHHHLQSQQKLKQAKMKFLISLLCLATIVVAGPLNNNNRNNSEGLFEPFSSNSDSGFIIGGVPAQDGQLPWQVSVQRGSFHFCGGSIISPNYVLSAAHCFRGLSPTQIQVRYNTLRSNSGGLVAKVAEIISHKDYYVGPQYNNDIALLKLATPLVLGSANAQAIPVASAGDDPSSGILLLSGWGDVVEGANKGTTVLQTVQVPLITRESCSEQYKGTFVINENMFCAGFPSGGKDTCQGEFCY